MGGVIWSATNPSEWTAEASGVDTDLFDVGPNTRSYPASTVAVGAVGAGGTILRRDSGGWPKLDTSVSDDLLDYANGLVVARAGPVYWVEEPLTCTRKLRAPSRSAASRTPRP